MFWLVHAIDRGFDESAQFGERLLDRARTRHHDVVVAGAQQSRLERAQRFHFARTTSALRPRRLAPRSGVATTTGEAELSLCSGAAVTPWGMHRS